MEKQGRSIAYRAPGRHSGGIIAQRVAWGCFDHSNEASVEVVLNKPGARYNSGGPRRTGQRGQG